MHHFSVEFSAFEVTDIKCRVRVINYTIKYYLRQGGYVFHLSVSMITQNVVDRSILSTWKTAVLGFVKFFYYFIIYYYYYLLFLLLCHRFL